MKQLLENLIKEWWTRPLPKIITRDIHLEEYANLPIKKVISLVGFRRTGKTFALLNLAQQLGQKNCVYLNLEDERLPKSPQVLSEFLDVLMEIAGPEPKVLLLDEIQNIPNWSSWVTRVNDSTPHQLFISGSSSKLSSSELPTELRGRSLTVFIQPLNFSEFLRFKRINPQTLPHSQILHLTREFLVYGGFPEVVLVEEGKKPLILDEYYQTFLSRDVIERHHLKNEEALKTLIQLLLNSSYYTVSKLAKNFQSMDFTVSKTSLARYLGFLEQSLFLQSIALHTPSLKNRLKAPRKPYFVDNFFLSRYSTAFSQNWGRLMENLVAQELERRLRKSPWANFYYWKDYQGREVDFVVREQEEIASLIQVSFLTGREELNEREIKSLLMAHSQLKAQELLLITWSWEGKIETDKMEVRCLPLYKFLYQPKNPQC